MDACARFAIFFLIISFRDSQAASDCFNIMDYVRWEQGPMEGKLWKSRVDDIITCARLCVRMTPCRSIMYNWDRKLCELNQNVLSSSSRRNEELVLYSEFSAWPAEVGGNVVIHGSQFSWYLALFLAVTRTIGGCMGWLRIL